MNEPENKPGNSFDKAAVFSLKGGELNLEGDGDCINIFGDLQVSRSPESIALLEKLIAYLEQVKKECALGIN